MARWREVLHEVIFEADTRAGKLFDVALFLAILAAITLVMLETVPSVYAGRERLFHVAEWVVTGLFTLEYLLRLVCLRHPLRYATSFYGIVDLLSILPTWINVFRSGSLRGLMIVRVFRLLRVFRVLKLGHLVSEAELLKQAVLGSRSKILVFLATVLAIVTLAGALMYEIEGPENGFRSIPESVYWAVVTLTTVGYGDITPATPWGKGLTVLLMISGYCLIIVPVGILSAELVRGGHAVTTQVCRSCAAEGHDLDARYCKSCGARL